MNFRRLISNITLRIFRMNLRQAGWFSHEHSPPEDEPFLVVCYEPLGGMFSPPDLSEPLWTGLGSYHNGWYTIYTSSTGQDNGFVALKQLDKQMFWAYLPKPPIKKYEQPKSSPTVHHQPQQLKLEIT